MAVFYSWVFSAFTYFTDTSGLFNELNFLKSLSDTKEYNPSLVDKTLNKFRNPKLSACHSNESCDNSIVLHFILPTFSGLTSG